MTKRIETLREAMKKADLDAYIVTGRDPHGSEIPPSAWRTRQWISGFTGSAGTVVVTALDAGLWTDFRYWIQAELELSGSGIQLFRDMERDVPTFQSWLTTILPQGSRVGVDGRTVSMAVAEQWREKLADADIRLVTNSDLIGPLWDDRPLPSKSEIWTLSDAEAGESRASRIKRLRTVLNAMGADTYMGLTLDGIAWLLNIRGGDVLYNPVVISYLILQSKSITWYTDVEKVPPSLVKDLQTDGVIVAPYERFRKDLASLPPERRPLVDKTVLSPAVFDALPQDINIRFGVDPLPLMKSVKNPTEVSQTRQAMQKDALALVKFFMDIESALDAGERITEMNAAKRLLDCRRALPGFIGESFDTISAYGPHGALCHYLADKDSDAVLTPGQGLFLIDSGAHWCEGTTDITRTITLGVPEVRQIQDYTLVLKGHIALSRARFPRGSRGYQLDVAARLPLWERGVDFGHGTGHGVGFLLNVHEGPQKLDTSPIDVPLEPGMIVSNEPGLYREGEYGIRIENLLVCRKDEDTEFGEFLAFDILTLMPYDRRLIDPALLDEGELAWVNNYHQRVYETLAPRLEDGALNWLRERTLPLAADTS